MHPQCLHSFFKHPIYHTAANRYNSSCSPNKKEVVQDSLRDPTNVAACDSDVEQCPPGQIDIPEASQRRVGSILSDGVRMLDRRSCIVSSMEIPVVAQLRIKESNGGLEYYYDIVVIILSAESDKGTVDCRHHR